MASLVTISKIHVDNLPPPWSAGWETRYFKVVIFCAGLKVGEGRPAQLDADGCIEMADRIQLSIRGRNERLTAIVFSSRRSGGVSWCNVPDCKFEGSFLKLGHSVWRPLSTRNGAGSNLWAEVETVLEKAESLPVAERLETYPEEEKSKEVDRPPLKLIPETHDRIDLYPSSASAGTGEWQTTALFKRYSDTAAWTGRTVDGHAWLSGLEALIPSLVKGRGLDFAPMPSSHWHVPWIQASSLLEKGGSITAPGRDSRLLSFFSSQSSVSELDDSLSESSSQSTGPRLIKHVIPGQQTGDGLVSNMARSALRCSSLDDSALEGHHTAGFFASQPTGARRLACAPRLCNVPLFYEESGRIRQDLGPRSKLPLPSGGSTLRSRAQFYFHARSELEETSSPLSQWPSGTSVDSLLPSYDSMSAQMAVYSHEIDALVRSHIEVTSQMSRTKYRFRTGDHRDDLISSAVDPAEELLPTENSSMGDSHTTVIPSFVHNTFEEDLLYTERVSLQSVSSSTARMWPQGSGPHATAVAQVPSAQMVEATLPSQTRNVHPSEKPAVIEHADTVYFTCVSPRSVGEGCGFQLRVSTSLRQGRDDLSLEVSRERGKEDAMGAGAPGEIMVERGKTVTVMLELPENVFKILDPEICGPNEEATNNPPSAQDFVWNGVPLNSKFSVTCLPGVAPGAVDCGVRLTQGSSVTRLSFRIEVGHGRHMSDTSGVEDCASVDELERTPELQQAITTEDDISKPTISGTEQGSIIQDSTAQPSRAVEAEEHAPHECDATAAGSSTEEKTADARVSTRSSVAYPPSPMLLASRVNPGPSVHESNKHGFRLTVREGSLPSPIGPITARRFAQVVQCENDGQRYLVKTLVDCQPSGIKFPHKPLWMDFIVAGTSSANISDLFQVLVCKNKSEGWLKVRSELRADEWGTYLRAAISDFCFFTCGRKINPSDPARLEDCEERDMIEVENATGVELFFVLVPVVFDTDRTISVTYTGNIGFRAAGVSLEAGLGSSSARVVKCHLLPAGFTPDDVSVAAGGNFYFCPPPNSTEGKLLVATISEQSQAGVPVKVIVLHGKFITPAGRRRVIMPIFLQSKSQICARLGPDDIPVNMVMIMAGLGSKTPSVTEASTPPQDTLLATSRPFAVSGAPLPAAVSATVPPPARRRRSSTTQGCLIV